MAWCQGGWCEEGWCSDYQCTISFKVPTHKFKLSAAESIQAKMSFRIPAHSFGVQAAMSKVLTARLTIPAHKFSISTVDKYTTSVKFKVPGHRLVARATLGGSLTVNFRIPTHKFGAEVLGSRLLTVRFKVPTHQLRIYATVTKSNPGYTGVVINTVNGAHTEYSGYDFNSFALFNGKHYCASSAGLSYENDLNDQVIAAYFKTGDIDSYRGTATIPAVVKREFDIFLGYQASGDMNLIVAGDKDGAFSYPIRSERVMIGKGFNSRYYSFKVVNVKSKTMEFQNIRLKAVATRRMR